MTASRSSRSQPDAAAGVDLSPDLREALRSFAAALDADGGLSPSTRGAYRRDVERYLGSAAAAGVRAATGLSRPFLRSHLDGLGAAGRRPATLARAVSALRRFHEHLRATGTCPEDPTEGLAPPRVGRREPAPLTVEEAERLLGAVRGDEPLALRDRALLELLYAAGLRVSELTALRPEDLLLGSALLRVRGRGARERIVPLGRAAVRAVERYVRYGRPRLASAGAVEALFLSARGRPLARMSVWKMIRLAARGAGIARDVSPQTLRHTFARHLLDGGFDLRDVQHLLGHADISTTLIYARADDERLQQLHRAFHPRS